MPITLDDEEYDSMETYALVGVCLHQLQCVESILKFCMVAVFQDEKGTPFEDLTDSRTRKKTLGQFIHRLREKSEIDPRFDQILGCFLEHRNTLVHELTSDKIFSFNSAEGRANIKVFLHLLDSEIDTVSKTLLGFIMKWIEPEKYADLTKVKIRFKEGSWLGDVEQIFAPHTETIVKPRESKAT